MKSVPWESESGHRFLVLNSPKNNHHQAMSVMERGNPLQSKLSLHDTLCSYDTFLIHSNSNDIFKSAPSEYSVHKGLLRNHRALSKDCSWIYEYGALLTPNRYQRWMFKLKSLLSLNGQCQSHQMLLSIRSVPSHSHFTSLQKSNHRIISV